jgi:hypothetical protein
MNFKKVIISLSVIACVLFLIDFVLGKVCDAILFNSSNKTTQYGKINYCMLHAQADVIIVGSSRANYHYHAPMMGDSLGLSVYNAGMDGRGLSYHSCIIRAICNRVTPQIIVMELFYDELNGDLNDRVSILRPYFYKDEFAGQTITQIDPIEQYKCKSAMFRYNSIIPRFVELYTNNSDSLMGYTPLADNHKGRDVNIEVYNTPTKIDSTSEKIFVDIIKFVKSRGIKLVITVSPELRKYEYPSPLVELCEKYGVFFLDNTNLPELVAEKSYFNDVVHLNMKGAEVYTKCFIHQLQNLNLK